MQLCACMVCARLPCSMRQVSSRALVRACVVVACGRAVASRRLPDAMMMMMRNTVHEGLTNELNVTIV